MTDTRSRLALVRTIILIVVAGVLLLLAGLVGRAHQRSASPLQAATSLPAPTHPAMQAPFMGTTVELAALSPTQRRLDLARLHATGIGWVRQRLDWAQMEPEPGRFDWAVADDLVAAILENELVPVLLLDGSPAWARSGQDRGGAETPFAPPEQPADFARFAAAVAARYGSKVTFYQLWDEPNVAPHWGNRLIDPVGYARLLAAASPALRAADPDAVILLAALAPTVDRGHTAIDEITYLQRLYAAGAAPHFDVVAVQPFGFGLPPASPPDPNVLNFRRAELVRRVMLAAGDAATPVWAVRFGWNQRLFSPWGTVSPANQVRFAQDAVALAWQEWPWLAALGWAIDRPAAPATDPLWGFALVDGVDGVDGVDTASPIGEALRTAAPIGTRPSPAPAARVGLAMGVPVRRRGRDGLARLGRIPAAALGGLGRGLDASSGLAAGRGLGDLGRGLFSGHLAARHRPVLVLAALALLAEARQGALLGMCLAIVLLPFHIYHKELALVGGVLAVPPAYAMLLATLPALARTFREGATKSWVKTDFVAPSWKVVATDWLALAWLGLGVLGALQGWPWPAYAVGFTPDRVGPTSALRRGADAGGGGIDSQRMILGAAVLGAVLAAGVGLWSWAGGGGTVVDGVRRLTGPTFSPNHMALYLERCLFLAIGLAACRAENAGSGPGLG